MFEDGPQHKNPQLIEHLQAVDILIQTTNILYQYVGVQPLVKSIIIFWCVGMNI